jgi:alkylation response protein AidB-like acyl-CoA dehydrogenase
LAETTYARDLAAVLPEPGAPASVRSVWRDLGAAGLIAPLYPEPAGRPSADRLRDLLTALDARMPVGVTLGVCVQVATALPLLREGARSGPAADIRDRALAGRAVLALAVTDAGARGSDLLGATTAVALDDPAPTLSGGKRWITNATHADHLLVLARHRPGAQVTNFAWLTVPADAPGVTVQAVDTPYFAGAGIGDVTLDGVPVDSAQLVGRRGLGLPMFTRHVATERTAGALWAVALCRRVLAETYTGLVARAATGSRAWDSPSVRQRFAAALVELERMAAMCATLAGRAVGADGVAAGLLKASAALGTDAILSACVGLTGADAWRAGGLVQLRAEAAMFGVAGGTVETVLDGVAQYAGTLLTPRGPHGEAPA